MIANRIRMRKKPKGGGEPIDTWDGIFADPEVGRVLKSKGLIADANQSSIEELSQITSLSSYFRNNRVITKFPELKYCTGLSSLPQTFQSCSNLTEITIPEGVRDMTYTFYYCTGLVNTPMIPNSVTDMNRTFYGCSSLVNAPIIGEGVTNMYYAFRGCTSLVNAPIIPNNVTDMNGTFYGCTNIDGVFVIKPVTPPKYTSTFNNVNVVAIYVPDESVDVYKTASGWSSHSSKIYPISQLPE